MEVLTSFFQILGFIAIIVATSTYFVHRNQLNFEVITSCVARFQEIVAGMESDDGGEKERAKKQYVDLCNEQLFYFSNGYITDEIAEEWLDGMIDFLPQIDGDTGKAHRESREKPIEPDLLKDYPRIKTAFTVDEPYDLESKEERDVLIKQVMTKVAKRRSLRRFKSWVGLRRVLVLG